VLLVLLGIIVIVKYRGPAGKTSELSVEERTKTSGEKGPKPVVSLPAQYTNSLGMKFAWIPPGSFLMGSPPGEEGHNDYEVQHRVRLTSGFWLGIYPVTQKEWQTVMESNPSHFKGNDRPVEQVSWQDCQEFCRKLSAREGKTYRLPSEAEWEYACRAGTTTAYYFGDDPAMLDDYAWYSENSGSQTRPVGQKKANAWGLYDMHGNVWEWCQDWYGKYPRSEQSDPQGPSGGSSRVFRGGCWHLVPQLCRSAGRSGVEPEYRRYSLGCRLALVPAGVSESSAKVGQRLTQVPPAGEK
jgi:formylglycine-generating enzyme required for sulfatase activity